MKSEFNKEFYENCVKGYEVFLKSTKEAKEETGANMEDLIAVGLHATSEYTGISLEALISSLLAGAIYKDLILNEK